MLHRLIRTLDRLNHSSPFEGYLMSVQRSGTHGTPTAEEARKDYRKIGSPQPTFLV